MAKKIHLNKQTLRELSPEEMEAVAGGTLDTIVAAELPVTRSGCHTSTDVCYAVMDTTTTADPAQ